MNKGNSPYSLLLSYIFWAPGIYFSVCSMAGHFLLMIYKNTISKSFILFHWTTHRWCHIWHPLHPAKGPEFFNHFHNPHFQVHSQDLGCLFTVCAATKTGARKLPKVHTKRQSKLAIWSLMIGSFSIPCCNFFTYLILTIWEIPVEYRLITCLPKAFPVFSPFSFSSRCLYSAYV